MDDDLGVREAADRLGVSTRTLRTYLKTGRLPGARQVEGKFGPEHRIPLADVEALREEFRAQGGGLPGVGLDDTGEGEDSSLEGVSPASPGQESEAEMSIPLSTIITSYQRALREVGRLQHQLKQLKGELALLREELMDRETLLAVMQEQKRG